MAKLRIYNRAEITNEIKKLILPGEIVLDIGCGIKPQVLTSYTTRICCDPWKQYLEMLQKNLKISCIDVLPTEIDITKNTILIHAGWKEIVNYFKPLSVDTVILSDVIEHLPKDKGLILLQKTIPLARKQIVVFTPWGFSPQCHPNGKDRWGLDGGKYQEHKSGWTPDDFDNSWIVVGSKKPPKGPAGSMYAIRFTEGSNAKMEK